jgi:hypothetical protein
MDNYKKPKCNGDNCQKISQYVVSGEKFCIGCITNNSRKHASHKRMEHQILSDITRGVRKSLPGMNLTMKYDEVYYDNQRPDLVISNTVNNNIVMVEVDESQHFTVEHLKKDDLRFKKFYDFVKEDGKSLSVVRVVPGEKSKNSMFKTEKTKLYKDDSGYIQKNPENYNKYIKESVNKIIRIIGDKQSYLYKDQQISVGPTIEKNSVSPIFSDTSSPDISPTIPRAKAIVMPKNIDYKKYSTMVKKASRLQVKYNKTGDLSFDDIIEINELLDNDYVYKVNGKTPIPMNILLRDIIPDLVPKKQSSSKKILSDIELAKKLSISPKETNPVLPKKVSASPEKTVILPELPKKSSPKKTSFFSFLGF